MTSKIVNIKDVTSLFEIEPIFQNIETLYGLPPNWQRPEGFETLSRIILEQQVSLNSAKAHYLKLKNYIIDFNPENIIELTDIEFRACYISKQKAKYLKTLSSAIINKEINLTGLSSLSEGLIREQLISIKGIGHWTVDVYLLFCLQHKNILPLGDIAVVNTIKELFNVSTKDEMFEVSSNWKAYRSLATYFLWHYYLNKRNRTVEY